MSQIFRDEAEIFRILKRLLYFYVKNMRLIRRRRVPQSEKKFKKVKKVKKSKKSKNVKEKSKEKVKK